LLFADPLLKIGRTFLTGRALAATVDAIVKRVQFR
jgi:hypothetical protein